MITRESENFPNVPDLRYSCLRPSPDRLCQPEAIGSGNTRFFCFTCYAFMYRSNRSFKMPSPPGIPRAFDTFDVPGRGGGLGIWLSESSKGWGIWSPCFRGGEFELHHRFHVNLWRGEHWGTRCYRIFVEKIVPLWPIGYEEKAYTRFVPYWKNLNFKLFSIGFRLWMYECILLLCLQWNTIPIPAIQYNNIK